MMRRDKVRLMKTECCNTAKACKDKEEHSVLELIQDHTEDSSKKGQFDDQWLREADFVMTSEI